MIEYVMLTGPTSTIECAHELGRLVAGRHLVVNLIPYNKTDVRDKLSCPPVEHVEAFRLIVSSYGVMCTVRRTMGSDIAGACGQLVKQRKGRGKGGGGVNTADGNSAGAATPDIEDGVAAPPHGAQVPTGTRERPAPPPPRAPSAAPRAASPTVARRASTAPSTGVDRKRYQELVLPLSVAAVVSGAAFAVSLAMLVARGRGAGRR